ncbi:MAG TPA: MFS transporter [Actinomycetota bacterium]|nr:MFS transporter [Actinomycetota bacterium]
MEPPELPGSQDGRLQSKGSTLSLLVRNRDFRLLFAAMVVSFAGDWFLFVALAGLVFSLTQSPALVAAQFAAMTVPFALATFVGGPLADRLNRQLLMVASDVLRGMLALGFFVVDRPSELWIVFVLTALIAALQAVFEPTSMASIPNLVDREDLPAANVLAAATWGTMLTVGSALGGLVVTAFGREAAYIADAASFFTSALLITQIRRPFSEPREPHHEHPGLLQATRETIKYARKDRRVLALLTVKGGFGLGAGVIALIPVLAFQVYEAGDRGTGILMAFRGVGIVLGPFLVRPFVRDDDLRTLFLAIAVSFAVFGLSYALVPWMASIYLAGALILVGHLGGGVQWTLSSYGLQLLVPDRIRGRILAFDQGLIELSVAASAIVAGWIADFIDVRLVMLGLAGVAGTYAVIWTAATTGIRRSLRRQLEPAPA